MGLWTRVLPGMMVWAGAEAFEVSHFAGALRLSIWESAYDRGLGGIASAECPLGKNSTAAFQLGYSHFEPQYSGTDAVNEIEARLGAKREFHPSAENFIYPRLGVHAGTSRNIDMQWHFIAGVDAEAVIPVQKSWGILLAFQPSFSMGEENTAFWRLALGFLYHAVD